MPVLVDGGISQPAAGNWVAPLAEHACWVVMRPDGNVSKGKRFDDVIDSGLAFLTAVAFALGEAHIWGDGTDGTIVGPGRLGRSIHKALRSLRIVGVKREWMRLTNRPTVRLSPKGAAFGTIQDGTYGEGSAPV